MGYITLNTSNDETAVCNLGSINLSNMISDGQLNNAPITFKELEVIRESFQISLEGLYHQRVLYPEITEEE